MGEYNDDALVDGSPEKGLGEEHEQEREADGSGQPKGPTRGPLLDLDERAAAKLAWKLWKEQEPAMRGRKARWEVNKRRRRGDPWARLIKDQDDNTVRVYSAPATASTPPAMLKTDKLCRKFVSTLFVDAPKWEPEPASGQDEDKNAAELSGRILDDVGGARGVHFVKTARRAVGKANSYASGFVHLYVERAGNGTRPRTITASAIATTVGQATHAPNPEGGEPVPQPGPFADRFIKRRAPGVPIEAAELTDNPAEAETEELAKLCRELLTGRHVRFLPETAEGIETAEGVQIGRFVTLGRVKMMFPKVRQMSPDDLRLLVRFRPEKSKDLLPPHASDATKAGTSVGTAGDGDKGPGDDAQVFLLTTYYTKTAEYAKGAYVVTAADQFRLYGSEWSHRARRRGPDGQEKLEDEVLPLPVAQFRLFDDDDEDDPYGFGLVDKIGSGDEVRASQYGNLIEHLYKLNNPHIFVPLNSSLGVKQLQTARGTPIHVNVGGEPKYEEVPDYPSASIDLLDRATSEMNDELEEAAQGHALPSVTSGKQQQQIIEQALVALSGPQQNIADGFERMCTIALFLVAAFFPARQRLKYKGEDGAYVERDWSGADLGSTRDVRIAQGSFTMLAPSAKAAFVGELAAQGLVTPEEHKRIVIGQARGLVELQDDPHLMRIRRGISNWEKGPPEGWTPPAPPEALAPPPAPPAPADGMDPELEPGAPPPAAAAPPPLPPPDPVWEPRPNDEEPAIAALRFSELSRAMSSTKYANQPPAWQAVFDAEYQRMRQAAGVQTVADEAAAAADAERAQADQAAQAEQAKLEASRVGEQEKHARELEKLQLQSDLEGQRQQSTLAAQPPAPPPGPDPAMLVAETTAAVGEQLGHVVAQLGTTLGEALKALPAPNVTVVVERSGGQRVIRDANGAIAGVLPTDQPDGSTGA